MVRHPRGRRKCVLSETEPLYRSTGELIGPPVAPLCLSCCARAELVRRFKFFPLEVCVLEHHEPAQWFGRDHLLIALALIGIFFSAGAVAFQVSAQEQALGFFRWRSAK